MNSQKKNSKSETFPAGRARRALKPRAAPPNGQKPAVVRNGKKRHFHTSDIHGISRLALTAVEGVIDLVAALHGRIIRAPLEEGTARGITGFTYATVRASTAIVSRWADSLLAPRAAATLSEHKASSAERDTVLAALNGLFGDHLAESGNPLAIPMRLRSNGHPLELKKAALEAAFPDAGGKLVILVHGLCRSDLHWCRNNHNHGTALARDLGYTPVYLHYNTGLHVSTNGREFSKLMEALVTQWPVPVEEIVVIGHSMGGLVTRSACYYGKEAGHEWLRKLRKIVFLGTPHHGAPLERGGNWLTATLGRNTFTAPFARLGRIRSAGITDLRHGNLLDEDWEGRDRFEHTEDCRRPVPFPKGVKCYAIAGTTGRRVGDIRDRLLGDGLIPLDTALGVHAESSRTLSFPKSRQWVAYGIHHLDLLSRVEVYEQIRGWLAQPQPKKQKAD